MFHNFLQSEGTDFILFFWEAGEQMFKSLSNLEVLTQAKLQRGQWEFYLSNDMVLK